MKNDRLLYLSQKIDRLSEKAGFLISLLLLVLIAVVLYGAIMRYVVNDMPPWAYEVSIFLYGIIAFAGGSYCLLKKKHVCVDIFKNMLSESALKKMDIVFNAVIFICMACIVYYAAIWAVESTLILERSEHQTTFNPQIWWFKWIVVIAIFAVILQSFSEIVKILRSENLPGAATGNPKAGE